MKLRLVLLGILLLAASANSAWARLGESESDVIARYGRGSGRTSQPCGSIEEAFTMNGFYIRVTFLNGVSVDEAYRTQRGETITDVQWDALLSANSEGYSWDEVPTTDIPKRMPPIKQMWRRPNGSTAVLTATSFECKSIFLIIAQEKAAHSQPTTPSTQGF